MFANDPHVEDWQADLGSRLRQSIEGIYASEPDEVACVEAMVRQIQETKPAPTITTTPTTVQLGVEGAFLHGHRSQVKFSIGGKPRPERELADLLVLGSYVRDGALQWQRVCFIQAKRASPASRTSGARFGIDEHQLALLRSFPEFEGVTGVFKGLKCKLRNRSGMLGAYGLLTAPGEFSVLSARLLGQILGGRQSLTEKDLTPAIVAESASYQGGVSAPREARFPWDFDPEHCPECRELLERFGPFRWRQLYLHDHGAHPPFGRTGDHEVGASVLSCLSLDEFVDAWSSLRLGEPWRAGVATQSGRDMLGAVLAAVSRVAAATGGLEETLHLVRGVADNQNVRVESDQGASGEGLAVIASKVQFTSRH